MSIEIANESGVAVPEETIVSVARFALDKMSVNPWRSCRSCWSTST